MKDLPEPTSESPAKPLRPKVVRKKKAEVSAKDVKDIDRSDAIIEAPANLVSEADAPTLESPSIHEEKNASPKKKKRRRRGKGNKAHPDEKVGNDSFTQVASESGPHPEGQGSPQPRQPLPNLLLDAEEVAKRAWKIFLAEVSEEGVALIRDQDARELSRRCFRLAEIFIEEQNRRR